MFTGVHCVAYLSPAGTTRRVAERIVRALQQQGIDPFVLDLACRNKQFYAQGESCCLWLGSPVYVDHALPQVQRFIRGLPEGESFYAVPYVTWGAVCSGVALPEMTQELQSRRWRTVAAAKVLGQHSSLWRSAEPLAAGHPNEEDLLLIDQLVAGTLEKLKQADVVPLAEQTLHYLPGDQEQQSWQKSLAKAIALQSPHQPDHQRCIRCGGCLLSCPVGALVWRDDYPHVEENCIRCHQCTRICPQKAYPYDADAVEARIRGFAAASREEKCTQIFL
ncbi:MAG: 4Fe-4S binding protein [Desulfuromonadaceae bacterium]|nr:4Fe-4S binding protein [Desulfuromonadaceae bacterium]